MFLYVNKVKSLFQNENIFNCIMHVFCRKSGKILYIHDNCPSKDNFLIYCRLSYVSLMIFKKPIMIVQNDVPFSLSILNDIALSCVIRVTSLLRRA